MGVLVNPILQLRAFGDEERQHLRIMRLWTFQRLDQCSFQSESQGYLNSKRSSVFVAVSSSSKSF